MSFFKPAQSFIKIKNPRNFRGFFRENGRHFMDLDQNGFGFKGLGLGFGLGLYFFFRVCEYKNNGMGIK
jgi:hypothetical protein